MPLASTARLLTLGNRPWPSMLLVLALLSGASLARRPSDASTCDYYAQSLYGANNSQTQYQ